MVLRILLLVVSTTLLAASPTNRCFKGCNCTENVAVCDTINLEPTRTDIFYLKVMHPQVPLILIDRPFKIRGLENINSITIENATILTIDNSVFAGLPLLSVFRVTNSNIPTINNADAFAAASNLKNLKISGSTLKKFEFVKSRSIEELDLSRCHLSEISENSFINLPYLSYINVDRNNISIVDRKAFSKLFFLQEIILSNNNISKLDSSVFFNNNELVSLDLSGNPLKILNFDIISDLEKLVLKSTNLNYFSKQLSEDLYLLNYLDLSDNNVNLSNNPFNNMEDLEHLDLSNNKLEYLDSHIFKSNHQLQKIILDGNHFRTLPKFICRRKYFETYFFSCKYCNLVVITLDTFRNFPMIVILNLSHNRITGVNLTEIQNLPGLIDLNLSYNNISTIHPDSFIKSTSLEKLNLAGNPITTLDVTIFRNNRVLRILDLSFCKFQNLWLQPTKLNITSLTKLNVTHNSLSSITPNDLYVIPSVAIFDISHNPLQCNENLKNTIIWLVQNEVSPHSNLALWKTHEQIINLNTTSVEYSGEISSWKQLAKEICSDDFDLDVSKNIETTKILPNVKINTVKKDSNEYDYLYTDEEDAYPESSSNDNDVINLSDLAYGSVQFKRQNPARYSFLWPTLVFTFTALSVLVVAANVMLLMLRSNAIPRRINLPHIKIPPWNSNGKLKKHSGSVYQPLSEEKSDSCNVNISDNNSVNIHNNNSM